MPAVGWCSAVTPPARHVASLPYELRDAPEPPIGAPAFARLVAVVPRRAG